MVLTYMPHAPFPAPHKEGYLSTTELANLLGLEVADIRNLMHTVWKEASTKVGAYWYIHARAVRGRRRILKATAEAARRGPNRHHQRCWACGQKI